MQGTIIGITSDGINNDILDIECLGRSNFKIGQRVDVFHYVEGVTDKQRGMVFALLYYAIKRGMGNLGHFSTDGLWEDIKQWTRDSHSMDYGLDFGLRTLKKLDVSMFVEILINEFFIGLCNVDVSGFFGEYEKFKRYEEQMKRSGVDVTFRDYWNAKCDKNKFGYPIDNRVNL
jgi:hypothetical protein